jgi:hypothetical protein
MDPKRFFAEADHLMFKSCPNCMGRGYRFYFIGNKEIILELKGNWV